MLFKKDSDISLTESKLKLEKDDLVINKDNILTQNGIYTTLIQAFGGFILSATAYISFRNLRSSALHYLVCSIDSKDGK